MKTCSLPVRVTGAEAPRLLNLARENGAEAPRLLKIDLCAERSPASVRRRNGGATTPIANSLTFAPHAAVQFRIQPLFRRATPVIRSASPLRPASSAASRSHELANEFRTQRSGETNRKPRRIETPERVPAIRRWRT